MRNRIRLTESDLHKIVRRAVSRVIKENNLKKRSLREARTHLGYWERNKPLNQDRLFEEMKKKVERSLRKAGLNLPFAVRDYADWNIAVDIPISAIKSYSDELVDIYNDDITDDLREEVLSIKSIIESAGYKVRISNKDLFDRWDDENDDYSMQKFVRFVLSSDELSKYRHDQYRTPEHEADFERENAAEKAAERAYEDDIIRRNR